MDAVCRWTHERKYRVQELVSRLIDRCAKLGLHAQTPAPAQNLQIAVYITTLVMNHLFTGHFKRTK
jgi:hypothetical protein